MAEKTALIVDFPIDRDRKSKKKVDPAKEVTFSVSSTMRIYSNHYDDGIYKGQKYSSWYKQSDYNSFRRDLKADVISCLSQITSNKECGRFHLDNELCSLGIEIYLSQELYTEVTKGRSLHKQAVLVEQARQLGCSGCCNDWKKLASVSTEKSKYSTARAIANAKNAQ